MDAVAPSGVETSTPSSDGPNWGSPWRSANRSSQPANRSGETSTTRPVGSRPPVIQWPGKRTNPRAGDVDGAETSAGRTAPALAGSGVGCGLAGRSGPATHAYFVHAGRAAN